MTQEEIEQIKLKYPEAMRYKPRTNNGNWREAYKRDVTKLNKKVMNQDRYIKQLEGKLEQVKRIIEK